MNRDSLTFIKLGGSLITDKRGVDQLEAEQLAHVCRGVKQVSQLYRCLVGHGGGSFGHQAAAAAGLTGGAIREEQWEGVTQTQRRVRQLHQHVLEALDSQGVLSFSMPPSSFMSAVAGLPQISGSPQLDALLDGPLTPVVHGDVLLDTEWGASIASTELLFLALEEALRNAGHSVDRVLWLGATDGFLDDDGARIPRLSSQDVDAWLQRVEGAAGTDVTGGIALRLKTVKLFAERGIESWLIDGRQPDWADRYLDSGDVGTRVLAR